MAQNACHRVMPNFKLCHMVVLATFMCNAITCGMCYANSAFYYVHWLEAFSADRGTTAMVGSLSLGVTLIMGPVASTLTNVFGYRCVVIVGGLVSSAGLLGSAFTTDIYTLLACYGCVTGAGWGLSYTPSSLAVTHYYNQKYHGLVLAASSAGVGFGQFVTPFVTEFLTNHYSWRGCLIIQSAINLHLCVAGAVLRPLPSMKSSNKESGGIFQMGIFKNADYNIFLVHCVLLTIGVSVVFVHIAYGVQTFLHVDSSRSSVAVSILGVAGLLGRVVHCSLVKLPAVNVVRYYMSSLVIAGIVLVLLPLVRHFHSAAICSFLIGYFMAVFGATQIIILIDLVELRYTLMAFGWLSLLSGAGMIAGAPLAGALYDRTGQYAVSIYFGGTVMLVSVLTLASVGWKWKQNKSMVRMTVDERNQQVVPEEGQSLPLSPPGCPDQL